MVQAKIYAGQIVVVFGVVVTWTWSAKQWTASAGEYLGHISGPAVDVNAPATGVYLRGGCRACAFGLSCAPRMGRGHHQGRQIHICCGPVGVGDGLDAVNIGAKLRIRHDVPLSMKQPFSS